MVDEKQPMPPEKSSNLQENDYILHRPLSLLVKVPTQGMSTRIPIVARNAMGWIFLIVTVMEMV